MMQQTKLTDALYKELAKHAKFSRTHVLRSGIDSLDAYDWGDVDFSAMELRYLETMYRGYEHKTGTPIRLPRCRFCAEDIYTVKRKWLGRGPYGKTSAHTA